MISKIAFFTFQYLYRQLRGLFYIRKYILFIMILTAIGSSELPATNVNHSESSRYLDARSFVFNNIAVDMENNGMVVSFRPTGHSGMEWPNGSNKYIDFQAGIWFAGKVSDQIRTAVAEYGSEFVPGPFGSDPNDYENRFYYITKYDLENPLESSDIINWPWMQGAPWIDENNDGYYDISDGDLPDMHGDFMVWYVANDADASGHAIFGTDPLNIEMSVLQWGYIDAFNTVSLQNMIFTQVQFQNKGEDQIDDMYISLWDDPDLGDAGDDFVGCDTTLSLGYCYNDGADNEYGETPPSIGRVFLQGPIVESPGDTAVAYGNTYPDYKNLPMSSFTKYINGDPVYYDPATSQEVYNYMSGLKADGSAFVNSATGEDSKFVHPCDPNDDTGPDDDCWVDSDDHASSDRRYLISAGPFNMAPEDMQEILFATIISQGSDPLNSISVIKEHAIAARELYENDFEGITPISFSHFEISDPTILADNLNHDGNWNNGETILLDFTITNPTPDTLTQIINLLSSNDVYIIDETNWSITLNPFENINISELSLSPYISLANNYSSSTVNLVFSISSSDYSVVDFVNISIPVSPFGFQPEIIWADHTGGLSDLELGYIIVDYDALLQHNYEVYFAEYDSVLNYNNIDDEIDNKYFRSRDSRSFMGINLLDITTGEILLENFPIPDQLGFDMPVTHGFKLHVDGIANGLHGIFMIHDGESSHEDWNDLSVASALQEHVWINYPDGLDYLENSNGGYYFATQGGGTAASETSYYERVFRGNNWETAGNNDFEMRFTAGGGKCWLPYTSNAVIDVPFELWNVGISTPDDSSDDYRMTCWIYDTNGSGTYDWHGDLEDSGGLNDPGTDWVYWHNPVDMTPGTAGYDATVAAADYGYPDLAGTEVMARTIWNNWNGYGSKVDSVAVSDLSNADPASWTAADTTLFNNKGFFINTDNSINNLAGIFTDNETLMLAVAGTPVSGYVYANVILFPAEGSVYRWITNKGATSEDKFSFNTNTIIEGISLYLGDLTIGYNEHSLEILFNNPNTDLGIGGFQFTLSISPDTLLTLTNASGGVAEDAGYTVDFNPANNIIVGFNLDGETITDDEGVLTNLDLNGFVGTQYVELCIIDALITDPSGVNLYDIDVGGCISIENQLGDVNLDNTVNVLDVVMIVNFVLQFLEPNQYQEWAADINGDGLLNIQDIVLTINIILPDSVLAKSSDLQDAHIEISNDELKVFFNGTIAGVELHTSGDYKIIDTILPEGWEYYQNDHIILLVDMEGSYITNEIILQFEGHIEINYHLISDRYGNGFTASIDLLPNEFLLDTAYPNPFNPTTTLSFAIPINSEVSLSIYNLQGREVSTLIDRNMDAGYHSVVWDANSYASGVYFVKMVAGEFVNTQKLMLVK